MINLQHLILSRIGIDPAILIEVCEHDADVSEVVFEESLVDQLITCPAHPPLLMGEEDELGFFCADVAVRILVVKRADVVGFFCRGRTSVAKDLPSTPLGTGLPAFCVGSSILVINPLNPTWCEQSVSRRLQKNGRRR